MFQMFQLDLLHDPRRRRFNKHSFFIYKIGDSTNIHYSSTKLDRLGSTIISRIRSWYDWQRTIEYLHGWSWKTIPTGPIFIIHLQNWISSIQPSFLELEANTIDEGQLNICMVEVEKLFQLDLLHDPRWRRFNKHSLFIYKIRSTRFNHHF